MASIIFDPKALKERENSLKAWACKALGLEKCARWVPISGDASFRRYFRIEVDPNQRDRELPEKQSSAVQRLSYIAVDAPPETENNPAFVDILERLQAVGVCVPELFAAELSEGYLLLSDLGDHLLLPELNESSADQWYCLAMEVLLKFQQGKTQGLPLYDKSLFHSEMKLFDQWFLPKYLGINVDDPLLKKLNHLYAQLEENALSQPQCFVHLDYHPRNIMLVKDCSSTMGIIDFQDAVVGPITYDLVSLLKNSYKKCPLEQVDQWSLQYRDLLIKSEIITSGDAPVSIWRRWFDWMGLQRHLKVAGIFARLNFRDHKEGYLRDIPRTISFITEMTERYCDELHWFHHFMHEQVVPALVAKDPQAASWFKLEN